MIERNLWQNDMAENIDEDSKWLELVIQHVKSLRYGVVEIVVHNSKVIQIEKTERVRLDKTESETKTHRR